MVVVIATAAAPEDFSECKWNFHIPKNPEIDMPNMIYSVIDYLNPATLPGAVVYAVVFLLLALLAARLVHVLIRRSMKRASDPTGFSFVDQLVQVIIYIVVAILYAQIVPPLRALGTALLASVSIVSIIIGLAAQSTLGNLIAGFALLLYRPFRVGEQVQLMTPRGIMTARIETLILGYTLLRDDEGNQIIVPNSLMANVVIIRLASKEK
jgi:small-conductance mechanosensitive channel